MSLESMLQRSIKLGPAVTKTVRAQNNSNAPTRYYTQVVCAFCEGKGQDTLGECVSCEGEGELSWWEHKDGDES